MTTAELRHLNVDTERYIVLTPVPPFVDILLQAVHVDRREYSKIIDLTSEYQNDPRMIEMVRQSGDASAKVPYLMDESETAASILATLREIAQPHLEHIRRLPDQMQATIHLLLSINTVPRGCEMCGLPALLEIDRVQGDIVRTLNQMINGRKLGRNFRENSLAALRMLDQDWPSLRGERGASHWPKYPQPLPAHPQMQYKPIFDKDDRLVRVHETCVIVEAPDAAVIKRFTPTILQRPRPGNMPPPATGSADWLIHEVGKVGRHFTRALLDIIKEHLLIEQVALDAKNYALINQHAQDALQEYVNKMP